MTGTIQKKVEDRGFGFIALEGQKEGDKGVFFHTEDVVGTTFADLHEGDSVTFDVVEGEKGKAAKNVTRN